MTNFISVKYCILYLLSLYTIGNYGLSTTRNPEQIKTTDKNMDDLSRTSQNPIKTTVNDVDYVRKMKQELIKTIDNVVEYSRNFEKRTMRFEEKLRNTREELETIRDENVKRRGEETLTNFDDQLLIARTYFRLVKKR